MNPDYKLPIHLDGGLIGHISLRGEDVEKFKKGLIKFELANVVPESFALVPVPAKKENHLVEALEYKDEVIQKQIEINQKYLELMHLMFGKRFKEE